MTENGISYIVLIDHDCLGWIMHELGVLRHVVKTVTRVTQEHHIRKVTHIALEVGETSGFVPQYLTRLFPVAAEGCTVLQDATLHISVVAGNQLVIKEIGY